MQIYQYAILFILTTFLSNPTECKEAAYVTVADEFGYTQIAIIDLDNPQIVEYIPIGPNARLGNLVLTPDGNSLLLPGVNANKIFQIDLETNTVVDSMAFFDPYQIAITPDAKHLLVTNWRNTTKLSCINWPQKQIVYEIEGERGFAGAEILITPDGRLAYLKGVDYLTVIDVKNGKIIKSMPLVGVRSLIWNDPEGFLYAIDKPNRSIVKIDSSSHQITKSIALNLEGNLSHIRFDSCKKNIYVSTDVTHQIFNIETEEIVHRLPTSSRLRSIGDVAFTPNNKNIYLTRLFSQAIDSGSSTAGQVWVLSTTQSVILYQLNIGFDPNAITMVVYPPKVFGDFNSDQKIDFSDFTLFATAFGTTIKDENWNCNYDLKRDNKIDFTDFIKFVQLFSKEK